MVGTCGAGSAAGLVSAALQFFTVSQFMLREPWPKTAHVQDRSRFDFIIVGAGTAGSTLAARLAQLDQYSVLLLEAGGYPPEEAIIPEFKQALKGTPYDWNFTTVNDGISSQGLAHGRQIQTRGKLLGGISSADDMVYSRGRPEDYNEWAKFGGHIWNWTNVLDYLKKTERMTDKRIINDPELMRYHGVDGEIEISGRLKLNRESHIFLDAFAELGIDIVNDMTYPHKIGAGRFSHTISKGRRASGVTALLNNVNTNKLHFLNDTLVTKILIENYTAVGVSALINGKEVKYYANMEVIVSAGTFNTPKLLMLSGIGPRCHLENRGIEVIRNLPVGNNLHDHIMVLNYLVANKGTCTVPKTLEYFEMIKYLYDFSGTLSYSDSVGAYLSKSGGENKFEHKLPDFGIYPTCIPVESMNLEQCLNVLGFNNTVCHILMAENKNRELIPLPVVHLKPQSRGKVRLNSTNPLDAPLIYSGTFGNSNDFDGFSDAVKFALSLVNTTYFKEHDARIVDFVWKKCKDLEGDDRLHCMIRDYAMPAWHAVGTAALGSVVDPDLTVKGIERLRVVDSSVIPVIVRGDIKAPVVMIAERALEFILEKFPTV